jgi:hypothetical protein
VSLGPGAISQARRQTTVLLENEGAAVSHGDDALHTPRPCFNLALMGSTYSKSNVEVSAPKGRAVEVTVGEPQYRLPRAPRQALPWIKLLLLVSPCDAMGCPAGSNAPPAF